MTAWPATLPGIDGIPGVSLQNGHPGTPRFQRCPSGPTIQRPHVSLEKVKAP
jgi:hypothetical protein